MGFFDRFKSKPEPVAKTSAPAEGAAPEPAAGPEGLLARFKRGLKRTARLLNTDEPERVHSALQRLRADPADRHAVRLEGADD